MNAERALTVIGEQQAKTTPRSAPWMVGEQLKDVIRREPEISELIWQDLTTGGMTLVKAEAKIKDYADKHRTGNFSCVTPTEAEDILREYFGLPKAGGGMDCEAPAGPRKDEGAGVIDLADFF